MQWLNNIVDEAIKHHPDGEILIESGGSPSGTYHLGHMRELIISDAILLELRQRGRQARHIYFVDDLDGLRKIPINVPKTHEKYLGKPLCYIPAPDGSKRSYADYFLQGLIDACKALGISVEFVRSHQKYRAGFFSTAIEKAMENAAEIRKILETVSGHKLGEEWSPIQVNEDGYLKKRKFVSIDTKSKFITYEDKTGHQQSISYTGGDIKLDWRIDWPARWWLLKVQVEAFDRDHATKGGSYDTGAVIDKKVFGAEPPLRVPYDFINLAGDTKKMSGSKGTGLDAVQGATIMPPEVVRYFILHSPPNKRLYFDPVSDVAQLMDKFAALAAKTPKTESEEQLLYVCTHGQKQETVSRIPFSHLVASYQASLKDDTKTLEVLERTEYGKLAKEDADIIKNELKFIDEWLIKQAPEDIKFDLVEKLDSSQFSDQEVAFLQALAKKVAEAPKDADGEWFHQAVYELKDKADLEPKELFSILYRALIGKSSGPRAGWFLSMLPRDWLLSRLRLEN